MSSLLYLWVGSKGRRMHLHAILNHTLISSHVGKSILYLKARSLWSLRSPCPPLHPRPSLLRTPGIQLCVTKPVLLESECSMRQGHMGFLPTSSLPSSPSLGCTREPPAKRQRGAGQWCHCAEQSHMVLRRDTWRQIHYCCVVVVEIEVPSQKTHVLITSANMVTRRSDSGLLHG